MGLLDAPTDVRLFRVCRSASFAQRHSCKAPAASNILLMKKTALLFAVEFLSCMATCVHAAVVEIFLSGAVQLVSELSARHHPSALDTHGESELCKRQTKRLTQAVHVFYLCEISSSFFSWSIGSGQQSRARATGLIRLAIASISSPKTSRLKSANRRLFLHKKVF